jgi:membrane protein
VGQVKDGLIVLATVGLAAVLMHGLGVVLGQAARIGIPFIGVIGYVALVAGLVAVFMPLYYVMPPVEMTAREALPGTIVAAVGWLILQVGFQIYAANAGDYAAYGLLGAVLLFLTWLYFAAVLVLVGAVVNVVLAGRNPLSE